MSTEEDFLRQRKQNYAMTARHPEIQAMLQDLAGFCHVLSAGDVTEKAETIDVNRTMIMLGRQQVFDRIQKHLNLSIGDLYRIYTGKALPLPGDDNA